MTEYTLAQIPDILTGNKEEFQQCGTVLFFKGKLFQSTRLYIIGILGGRPATLCLVKVEMCQSL